MLFYHLLIDISGFTTKLFLWIPYFPHPIACPAYIIFLHFIFFFCQQPKSGIGRLVVEVSRSNTIINTIGMTPLDESSARRRGLYLPNTQHSQKKNIHVFGGIWTRNPSMQAATGVSSHISSRSVIKWRLYINNFQNKIKWEITHWALATTVHIPSRTLLSPTHGHGVWKQCSLHKRLKAGVKSVLN